MLVPLPLGALGDLPRSWCHRRAGWGDELRQFPGCLVRPAGEDVAEVEGADRLVVEDHGQVPRLVADHGGEGLGEGVVRGQRYGVVVAASAHRGRIEHPGVLVLGDRPGQVPGGDQPGDVAVLVTDRDRGQSTVGEQLGGLGQEHVLARARGVPLITAPTVSAALRHSGAVMALLLAVKPKGLAGRSGSARGLAQGRSVVYSSSGSPITA